LLDTRIIFYEVKPMSIKEEKMEIQLLITYTPSLQNILFKMSIPFSFAIFFVKLRRVVLKTRKFLFLSDMHLEVGFSTLDEHYGTKEVDI
jgi:hypothetical protein